MVKQKPRLKPKRNSVRQYPWKEGGLFKCGEVFHTVEDMLEHASLASETGNLKKFKTARKKVLEYLEPQYLRVVTASTNMVEYIKSQKRSGRLFDTEYGREDFRGYKNVKEQAEGMLLLQDYAASLHRDLTPETRIKIALRSHQWQLGYSTQPREKCLETLDRLLGNRTVGDELAFIDTFKSCMDEVNSQYLSIRKTGKAVFEDDPTGTTHYMGTCLDDWAQPWRCDQHIDWRVNEPDFGPDEDPDQEVTSDSSFESDWDFDPSDAGGDEDGRGHSDASHSFEEEEKDLESVEGDRGEMQTLLLYDNHNTVDMSEEAREKL